MKRTPPPSVVSAETVAARVRRELAAMARDAGSFDAQRYFRGDHGLKFHNVGSSRVHALARDLYRELHAVWPLATAMQLAELLIRDPYLETKSVGIEVLARYRSAFTPAMLPTLKRWLARNDCANWATTDTLCGLVLGPLLLAYPALIPRVAAWSRHSNMWVRRASAVALIKPISRGLALDEVYAVATQLEDNGEDLIHKALGWALREAGKADPLRLERYLRDRGPAIPRTTVRYAIERFSPHKRSVLLRDTKRPA